MTPRFYAPNAVGTSSEAVALPPEEARHLRSVLRLGAGAMVHVFDGRGHEWEARVAEATARRVIVCLQQPAGSAPEPRTDIVLALAMLKSDYMDGVIRDAAMIGASTICPLITARAVIRARQNQAASLAARWHRLAVAGSKQSGRAVVPTIDEPLPLATWLERQRERVAARLVLTEPRLATGAHGLDAALTGARSGDVMLLVGPEGGWEESEIAAARAAGFHPWTINPRVLRADAIPIAALSILLYALEYDRD